MPPHGLNRVEADEPFYGFAVPRRHTPITSFFYGGEWSSEAYRPVYAAKEGGACESPLAGLHFTTDLLASIQEAGINVAFITLHVAGSWLPLREDQRPDDAEPEAYEISEETAALIASTRARGNRVVAVGSTSVRCLESAARDGSLQAGAGVSRMYITPGHHFQIVDAYFTAIFHPARSSLMVLDAAFCRKDLLLHAYGVARSNSYLFFEFGDAVLYL
ncbi:MAG: S-adenosylmethionine:tRNA ribosyltransferase-isomerase [Caulobacteraceae bacterium]|nr:S-adenosylmethionine:tRNA ribosyltransferase-isomerase [Caulobacteraceae bacterium]